jgi:hypothetical protein
MDAWCALWFWPLDKVGLLDGTDAEYATAPVVAAQAGADLDALLSSVAGQAVEGEQNMPEPTSVTQIIETRLLFAMEGDQLSLGEGGEDDELVKKKRVKKVRTSSSSKKAGGPVRRRDIIPLADVDDWIAFLESMVGTGPVPENTLATTVDSLKELKALEDLIQAEMGMDDARKAVETRYPWMRVVRDIAEEQGFLHWELDFAGVFASGAGGFDLQVGNPPWVRPTWAENPVIAEYEPWFMLAEKPKAEEKNRRREVELERGEVRKYLISEVTSTVTMASYLASAAVYPLISGSQPDLYRAFMCEVWSHSGCAGTAGMVHPDTHFAGEKEAELRAAAYRRLRVHGGFVNQRRIFPEPVGHAAEFGIHIYGSAQEIDFANLAWLFSADVLRLSFSAIDDDDDPGVKYKGIWDERPHPKRVVRVTTDTLKRWRRLAGDEGPLEHTRLLTPVSTAEGPAIDALGVYPLRLGTLEPDVTRGYDESGSKKAQFGPGKDQRLIDYNTNVDGQVDYHAKAWSEVILKGPQIGVANPLFKQPSQGSGEVRGLDPKAIADDEVPEAEYRRVAPRDIFLYEQDKWPDWIRFAELLASEDERSQARLSLAKQRKVEPEEVEGEQIERFLLVKASKPYSNSYRVAWRRMIAPDTERALYAAIIPPGVTHVITVQSARVHDSFQTALFAGFLASLPIDYLLRTSASADLTEGRVRRLPAPQTGHPLAPALLLRTLRLNALTTAYADLWAELYDPKWPGYEPWAIKWPHLKTELHNVTPTWQRDTPIRTEYARRAALVEIDALVAVWIGIEADTLIAMYRARFPILQDFDRVTWFDADERKIAGKHHTYGFDQTKDHWTQFEAYQEARKKDPETATVPDGYSAPFYKANREREMREAHAYFKKRLDDAVAKGLWDPVKMEVPNS